MLLLSTKRIPHFGRKVRGSCCCFCCILVDIHTPHSSLVTFKGADPVASVPLAQHRFAIFTCRDGIVDAVGVDLGESEEDHWPSVSRTGEGGLPQAAHPCSCLILLDGMSIGPRRSPSLGQQSSKPAVGATFKPGTPLLQLVKQQMSLKKCYQAV